MQRSTETTGSQPVNLSQASYAGHNTIELNGDDIKRIAYSHNSGAVGDILSGSTPMASLTKTVTTDRDNLLHNAKYRIPNQFGILLKLVEDNVFHLGLGDNLITSFPRNYLQLSLNLGQCNFLFQVIGSAYLIRPKVC